jgi:NADPH:quinone reductase-like Zn-dependent oxidoreductase
MPSVTAALVMAHGAPPRISNYELPEPGAGQCLVRVTAAPLIPLDRLCATGTSYFGPPAVPYVPGVQGAGVVQRGDRLPAGTRVCFNTDAGMRPGDGAMAEFAVVDEAQTVPLPDGVDDATAAALGLSAVAAWSVLIGPGRVSDGAQVLVLGASGVVGQVAVQAARVLGAGRVVAMSRSAEGRELASRLGADAVVDPTGADLDELAERLGTACEGALDLVVDPVCGDAATAALRVLGAGGRLVNLGSSGGPSAVFESAVIRSRQLAILGYTNNALSLDQRRSALTAVLDLAAAGTLRVAHEKVPLTRVTELWDPSPDSPPGRLVFLPAD